VLGFIQMERKKQLYLLSLLSVYKPGEERSLPEKLSCQTCGLRPWEFTMQNFYRFSDKLAEMYTSLS